MVTEKKSEPHKELLASLLADKRLSSACRLVSGWSDASCGFRDFLEKYADKIRKKFKNAVQEDDEKVRDVLVELECIYRFARTSVFLPEYEPYASEKTGNPDTLCHFQQRQSFNVEIKRIRKANALILLERSMDDMIRRLRQIKSSLGFCVSAIDMEMPNDLPWRFQRGIQSAISQCLALVGKCERELPFGAEVTYPIEGLEDSLTITFQKIPGKPADSPTANLLRVYSLPYTQQEWRKLADKILDCLRSCQVRGNMINALLIVSDSDTHEPEDLHEAIEKVWRRAQCVDDEFFKTKDFEDTQAFLQKLSLLSCILVMTRWSNRDQSVGGNYLWENPKAEVSLPKELGRLLRQL